MKWKLINNTPRTYAVIFAAGDEVIEGLMDYATKQRLQASQFTGVGAFKELTVGFFNVASKKYDEILINEQVEVLSMIGDVTLKDGAPQLHAHVVVGKADATAHGGHLLRAIVRPTLEIVLVESPHYLRRIRDPQTGLALIEVDA
jgi:predicted DNA-binding protein with PD1-like motif